MQRACGMREEKQRARCFAIGAGDWADQLAAAMATTTRSVVVLAAPLVWVVVTCLDSRNGYGTSKPAFILHLQVPLEGVL